MKLQEPDRGFPFRIWGASWGALSGALLVIQLVSGLLLALNYLPGNPAGYQSTFEIMWQVPLGWLIRGMHRYGAYALILAAFLHLFSVFYRRSFRPAPFRGWLLGNLAWLVLLCSTFTGLLLPLDLRSGCATRVALSLLAAMPGIGNAAAHLLFGFSAGGGFDPNRFHTLHISFFPLLLFLLLWRHQPRRAEGFFPWGWGPVLLTVLLLAIVLCLLSALVPARLGEMFDPLQVVTGEVRPAWIFMSVYLLVSYSSTPGPILAGLSLLMTAWMSVPWLDRRLTSVGGQRILTGLAALLALALVLGTLLAYPLTGAE